MLLTAVVVLDTFELKITRVDVCTVSRVFPRHITRDVYITRYEETCYTLTRDGMPCNFVMVPRV